MAFGSGSLDASHVYFCVTAINVFMHYAAHPK